MAGRPGPARGSLTGVTGLNLRLHRGALLGWLLAMAGLGVVPGGIAPAVGDFVGSAATARLLERTVAWVGSSTRSLPRRCPSSRSG